MIDSSSGSESSSVSNDFICAKCSYNLTGIDISGSCPECGTILIESCVWCDYDLTNTAPDSPCPECGVPAVVSAGKNALAPVPTHKLRSIHTGFRLVTYGILLYILSVLAFVFGLFSQAVMTGIGEFEFLVAAIIMTLVNYGLVLVICLGWFKLSAPLQELPEPMQGIDRRKFLKPTLWLFSSLVIIWMLYSLASLFNENDAEASLIEIAGLVVWVGLLMAMVLVYYAQLRYLNWFAKLLRNTKMEKRTRHMIWSGPLIAVVGALLFMLGPLIVLVMYWNLVEYLRRDLKKLIKARKRARAIITTPRDRKLV